MKRLFFLLCVLFFSRQMIFAKIQLQKPIVEEPDFYEYNNIVSKLISPAEPYIDGNYIVFTASAETRFTGIAFDFENYKTVHAFKTHNTRSIDGKITNSIRFFLLERPADLSLICYRVIIDGIWTTDPLNPQKEYDFENGLSVSVLDLGGKLPEITYKKDSCVKFIYNGKPGQTVRLGGNFTNWDSWIYELNETKPGFYELSLNLPKGKYYYNYYLGMKSIVDVTNPERVYTNDGRTASVIEVD